VQLKDGRGKEYNMPNLTVSQINSEITSLETYWNKRNTKFRDWYSLLLLIDTLASRGMESYVSNEPATFYQMAHYLLTKGDISHFIPVVAESAGDLDMRARVHRGCQYMWNQIDKSRKMGGSQSFIDDLSFYVLVLGWYATIFAYDDKTNLLKSQIWNPYDVYPRFANESLVEVVHKYPLTQIEAKMKAQANGWEYNPGLTGVSSYTPDCTLSDFFVFDKGVWSNIILIDGKQVTDWNEHPEAKILVAPIGGYPDRGSLTSGSTGVDWKERTGKGIFEINSGVSENFNKWKSMIAQILRDTAQPITQEFAATSQATPEQLRERGAHFHYAPGEAGIQRVPPPQMPAGLFDNMALMERERQKGSFNDAVYGMVEGEPGYALSLLASSSANQILYPYMDAKHFVLSEADAFWLSNLKKSGSIFQIKGKLIEKIEPKDIPEDVEVIVESDVATPKDWLERGTIGGMVRDDLDKATLLTEIYKMSDAQGILRRKELDRTLDHPMTVQIQLISGYRSHADYLDSRGDRKQAALFRKAADTLESQMGQPAPGQGNNPGQQATIDQQRQAGQPASRPTVPSNVASPEAVGGFTPQQLRRSVGQGKIRIR
jgi:hypothetical protein